MSPLINNLHDNHHRKARQTNFKRHAHTICNLHLCQNFILVLHENTLAFSMEFFHVYYYSENTFSFVVFLRSHNIYDTYVCTCLTMQSHTFYDMNYAWPTCYQTAMLYCDWLTLLLRHFSLTNVFRFQVVFVLFTSFFI